ncbi:MAG: hypothetical protein JXB05_12265, partial [Myxococcaceae bacterium]|nr:hypothetical protein [Myxococcaceae bacterium]
MRRLLALLAPLALLAGTGCVVTPYHGHTRTYRTVEVVQYRYSGAHPIANAGGWCLEEYDHVHDYAPETQYYAYTNNVYTYRGPTTVWYLDYHPVPHGGHCNLSGRHYHDYYPRQYSGWDYSWDRNREVYVYTSPRTHGASPASGYSSSPAPTYPRNNYPPPSNSGSGWERSPPGGTGHGSSGGGYGNRPPPSGGGYGNRPPPGGTGGWGNTPPPPNGGGYGNNPPPPSNGGGYGNRPPPGGNGGWGNTPPPPPSGGGTYPPPPSNGGGSSGGNNGGGYGGGNSGGGNSGGGN